MKTTLLSIKRPFVLMALIISNLLFFQFVAKGQGALGACAPAPSVTSPVTYCQDVTAVQLTAIGISLLWYTTETGGIGSATAPTPSTLSAGTTAYFVSSTDPCEGPRAKIDVIVNPIPTVTDPLNQVLCMGSSTSLISFSGTVSGTNFSWTNDNISIGLAATGNGDIPVFLTNIISNLNQVANISVTPSANGCVGLSKTLVLTLNAPPSISIIKTNVSVCGGTNDGTITATCNGGSFPYTYSWTGTNSFTAGNVPALTGLPIGYYNCAVTDNLGCAANITNIHIGNAFSVYVTNNGTNSSACANTGSIILYGNAGVLPYSYSLDGSNYQSENTFPNLAAGTYTAYVKDAAGCVSTKTVTIASTPEIIVTAYSRPSSVCTNNGSIELYRTGGMPSYTYSIDNITYQTSNVFLNLAAGNYTGYVKDSKNCIGSVAVTVIQGPELTITAKKANTSSCINDGSIQLSAGGGVAAYSYSLDNVNYQTGNSFGGLAAGNYTGYVKDSKGCISQVSVTINTNPVVVTAYAVAANNCTTANGSIQLFRTGGTGPYMYSLNGTTFQSSTIFTGLIAGIYNGYVRDSKTCIGSLLNIVVGPNCPPPPVASSTTKIGIDRIKDIFTIQAYPNPSNSEFTLVLTGNDNYKVSIMVTDMFGRKVFVAEGTSLNQYRFGKDLKAGIYIVQATKDNKKQSLKIIKE